MRHRRNNRQYGSSLIEVLITLVIMAAGLLGMGRLQIFLHQSSSDAVQHTQAVFVLQALSDRIRTNPEGMRNTAYVQAAANEGLCGVSPGKMCANYLTEASSTQVNASTACSPTDMAIFDVWELSCGHDNATAKANAVDSIFEQDLMITCVDLDPTDTDGCSKGSDITLLFSFQPRATHESKADEPQFVTFPFRM